MCFSSVLSALFPLIAYLDHSFSSPSRSGSCRMLPQMSALTSLLTGAGFPRMQVAELELKVFLPFWRHQKAILHTTKDAIDKIVSVNLLLCPTDRRGKGKEFAKDLFFFLRCLSNEGSRFFFLADISRNIDVVIDVSAKKPCKECVGSEHN